jgi:hypothetical protein
MLAAAEELKSDEKTMQGVGTYRALDNPAYMSMFHFMPPIKKNGELERKTMKVVQTARDDGSMSGDQQQQDVPYIVFNAAYLRDEYWPKVNFDTTGKDGILQ